MVKMYEKIFSEISEPISAKHNVYVAMGTLTHHSVSKSSTISSTKEQLIMKKGESAKLNESVENAKPESRAYYQILLN